MDGKTPLPATIENDRKCKFSGSPSFGFLVFSLAELEAALDRATLLRANASTGGSNEVKERYK